MAVFCRPSSSELWIHRFSIEILTLTVFFTPLIVSATSSRFSSPSFQRRVCPKRRGHDHPKKTRTKIQSQTPWQKESQTHLHRETIGPPCQNTGFLDTVHQHFGILGEVEIGYHGSAVFTTQYLDLGKNISLASHYVCRKRDILARESLRA